MDKSFESNQNEDSNDKHFIEIVEQFEAKQHQGKSYF